MAINKTCKCGKHYAMLPADAVLNDWGYWWNCECKSTMFKRVILIPVIKEKETT